MPLKYACFISYAHGTGKYVVPFVEALHEELESQLESVCDEKVYLDKERLRPGYEYNEKLAEAICHSACMIVVYTPIYGQHDYCLREFKAMEQLEKKRRKLLGNVAKGHRLIIPVVFKGRVVDLPLALKSTAHCCDASPFALQGTALRNNPAFGEALKPVCDGVADILNLLTMHLPLWDSKMDCSNFSLPKKGTVPIWNSNVVPSFPGRAV